MAATQRRLLLLCGLLLCLASSLAAAARRAPASGATPTAYDMLERFDFPKGILPEGVQGYALSQDGSFEVFLNGDCEFKLAGGGGYLLKYKKRITGRAEKGSLSRLSGVSVKILFSWIDVADVVRAGDDLSFHVGPVSQSFPLSNFDESPQCGCGFRCDAAVVVLSANS